MLHNFSSSRCKEGEKTYWLIIKLFFEEEFWEKPHDGWVLSAAIFEPTKASCSQDWLVACFEVLKIAIYPFAPSLSWGWNVTKKKWKKGSFFIPSKIPYFICARKAHSHFHGGDERVKHAKCSQRMPRGQDQTAFLPHNGSTKNPNLSGKLDLPLLVFLMYPGLSKIGAPPRDSRKKSRFLSQLCSSPYFCGLRVWKICFTKNGRSFFIVCTVCNPSTKKPASVLLIFRARDRKWHKLQSQRPSYFYYYYLLPSLPFLSEVQWPWFFSSKVSCGVS